MICDMHIHSCYSFDGTPTLEEICTVAMERGVGIIAITDHADMVDTGGFGVDAYYAAEPARLEAFAHLQPWNPGVEVLYGIEIGNGHDAKVATEKLMEGREFDYVLGSVHFLPDGTDIYKMPFASPEEIDGMWREYFASVLRLVNEGGFDCFAHLDYPLRKMEGKVSACTVEQYADLIDPILQALVKQQIALEVNTRGMYDWQQRVCPEDWVLRRYRELGGKYVVIGSDTHTVDYIGTGFAEAAAALKRCGFDSYTIYRKRQPVQIPLD